MSKHPKSEFVGYRPLFTLTDGRRFQRVEISLSGRFMLESRLEYPCHTVDISLGGMRLSAAVKPRIGEKIILYIDALGRFEGEAVRQVPDGFAVTIKTPSTKRDMLADKLTWFANRISLDLSEERRHHRIAPFMQRAMLRLPDGHELIVKIRNFSTSGIAIETNIRPEIGTKVVVGDTPIIVLRYFEGGFAGEFVTPFAAGEIHEATKL
jgi:hypothetical protein